MTNLFSPLLLRSVELRNRIAVSPMCQYSSKEGFANEWHLVHLGARAVGGASLVFTEATAVEKDGRISPQDLGLWTDDHVAGQRCITTFLKNQGASPGIQLAHAGRKASTFRPWGDRQGVIFPNETAGWQPKGPTATPFEKGDPTPMPLGSEDIGAVITAFQSAAGRALDAGYEVIEIHSAHGYLLHSFLSPLTNNRKDNYGGNFENRTKLLREVISAVREIWPDTLPLFVRLSSTDWHPDGWDIEDTLHLARKLTELGVDLIDCSSGGIAPGISIPVEPGYQVCFAERVRKEANIASGAVGLITDPNQANEILVKGKADLVLLGREFLRDPYWPHKAANSLGTDLDHKLRPPQYRRS